MYPRHWCLGVRAEIISVGKQATGVMAGALSGQKSYSLSIGSFFFVCGPVVSDNWSIPGKYIVNDFSFVFSYPGDWLDEDGACETCSLVVTPSRSCRYSRTSYGLDASLWIAISNQEKTPRKIIYSFLKRPDSSIPTRTMSPSKKKR
jgi:hypothetical protein